MKVIVQVKDGRELTLEYDTAAEMIDALKAAGIGYGDIKNVIHWIPRSVVFPKTVPAGPGQK